MNKREILIICLMICFIFSLQAVVAADAGGNSTDDVMTAQTVDAVESNDVSAYSLPDSNDQTLQAGSGDAGTFSDLQNNITSGTGQTVTLNKNFTYDSSTDTGLESGITISDSVTIDGQNIVTIDGNNQARAFNIAKTATVTFKNIKFINCNPATGAGGSIYAAGTVHIINCEFINNTANYDNGGAVCIASYGSTITSSYFEGNRAIKNPANMNSGAAGAVFVNGNNTTISHTQFVKNWADLNGGAVGSSGNRIENCTITNCTFTSNTANGSAGAVGMQSKNFHISDSTFKYNEAKGNFTTYPGNGGGMVMRGWDSYAYNCTFINNTAAQHGGAAYSTNTSYNPLNNNTGFVLCTFINNTAGSNGGAVDWAAGATHGYIEDSTFTNNTAKRSGGAVHWSGHYGSISNSTFTGNNATGEVISTIGGITGGGDGGAVVWVGSHGIINDSCIFTNNYAKNRGGAVFMHGNSTENCTNVTVYSSTFEYNVAGANGGALDWHSGATDGAIHNSTFRHNVAGANGGAVYWRGHHGDIIDSNFTNNTAKGSIVGPYGNIGDGGAVFWAGINGTVDNCRFIDNNAIKNTTYDVGGRGGAVFIDKCSHDNKNTTFKNVYFENNTAGTNGGAIDWHAGAQDGLVENAIFINNTAKRSGGAIFWNGHNGTIRNANFTNNRALGIANATSVLGPVTYGGDGGAVMWSGALGTVENARFINNTAAKRGGAVFLQAAANETCDNTIFRDSYFENNTAGTNGGAIDWNKGAHNGIVENVTFVNNVANRSAGAIFWNGHNGTIRDSKFYNNSALGITNATSVRGDVTYGGDGGAVMWSGSLGNVENCTFINNTAAKRGGAVFLQGSDTESCNNTAFRNSIFENNRAGTNGGAIDWNQDGHHGLVDNVTFFNNTAGRSGGAIFWHGENGTVKNSRFISNRATGTNWEYTLHINMGNTIEVKENGTLVLGDIIVIQNNKIPDNTSTSTYENKLVVLNYTDTTKVNNTFESWVLTGNATAGYEWKKLDEINITISESIISPVDWAIDQYFGGDGGTILWSGDIGLIEKCTFIDSNSARRGGGAYMTGGDYVSYIDCYFENCTSGTNGGGVDWLAGANYGKIYNCTFNNTRAARSAGAIYYDGWYGDMQNITIINTQSWGGALKESKDKRVKYAGWDSSHWDTNTTGGDAGAIMYTGSFITVYNVTFTNCNASGRGGAVFLQDNHNVTFDSCTFENNIASGTANNTFINDKDISSGLNTWLTGYGGAIAFDVGATNGTIKNSKFTNNTAIRLGGAISFGQGSSNAHVWNSTFDNNTAYRNGGAIAWDGTNGKMEDCNFTNNSALGTDINRGIFDLTSLSQIKNVTSISEINSEDYIYVLVTKDPTTNKATLYEMYVYKNNTAIKLEETTETGPSPTDWTVDEYFGGDGGTIYWRGDKGIVDNCRFIGSNSARRGGGAYMTGSNNITFQNSYFFNCTSGTNGGGLDWLAGANYGKVINCTFEETCAVRSAGAIYYDGDYGEFRDIVVKNTHTHGGELESKNDLVNYAGWDASHWDTNTTGGDGGAIMLTGDHIYIYNATFINCTAAGCGGAIFLQDNNNVTIELCTFENNRALGIANNTYNNARDTSSGLNKWYTGNGGAIAFDKGASNGTILDSKFINNTATRNGGAISFSVNSTEAYIFNSSFDNNTAYRSGGAIKWDGTNGNVSYCNFTGNKALGTTISTEYANITSLNDIINKTSLPKPSIATDNKLYVIVTYEGTKKVKYELYVSQVADTHYWLKIDETTETGPSPIDWATDEYFGGDGGSIYWAGDNATIDHCIFIDSNSARRGGGAYMTGGDHVSYINCTFENCTSGTNGGGLDWLAGANYGKVIGCNFTNTQAARSAGAIYYDGDYGEFRNIIIKNTTAHGGEINQSEDGTVKYARWDASHWDTNTTGGDGGAIMFTGDHIKLYNVNVTDCTATGRGGAVFLQDNHNVTFELCRFENNHALGTANNTFNDPYDTSSGLNKNLTGHGGAIAFDMGATSSSIINSTFINNTVSGKEHYGGAVYFRQGASEDKIINSTFKLNHADEDGGAIFIEGKNCELHNSTFTSNYAGDDGGAIFWKGDSGTIYNITCVNNTAVSSHGNSKGGTICLNGNNIALSNSSFKQSYAGVTGGALFVTGDYVNVTGCEFEDCNVSSETGGAIQIVGNHVEVRNSTFEDCHAPNGGAIYAEGQYVKIIDAHFNNNTVKKDGAALYVNGDYSELHNSTFNDNVAGDDGGAIYWQGSHGTIYNITCENNRGVNDDDSNSNGGTICITGNEIALSESSFKNSSAGAQGGAIFVTGNSVNIMNSEFETCNATHEGGAIYVLGDDTTISDCTFEDCNGTLGGAIFVEGDRVTISANIKDTHALGEDSYGIVIDYKFYKDNVKEIKYDITDMIEYVATIKLDDVFTNVTIAGLNTTLNELYVAVDNILTANGINATNVTKALDIVRQLNTTLIQLNATLAPGKDKNITLQLIGDIENIGNELNYLIDISKTKDVPDSITTEIDGMISEVEAITPGNITDADKTALISKLNEIRNDVGNILNGDTFNSTSIENALKLLNNLTDTLKELNATLPNGDDKNAIIKLLGEAEDIENQLTGLSDMVVVPEIVSKGGAIYISGNDALINNSVINNTDAVYGGGIYISGHDVKVDNSEFINLYSVEDGGAIYISGLRGNLYNSMFINNTAGDDGGAINWDGNYGTIYNITCENNRGISLNGSSSNGGTISLTGNDTSIANSYFGQSYALISGGAIFVTGNDVNITDSVFEHCNVSMDIAKTNKNYANGGGAIYVMGNASNIVNCTFDNSTGREGGAIYVQGNNVTIDKSNFTDSFALNGGALYVYGDSTIISNSHIEDSNATYSGGAIYVEGIDADIIKSSFNNTRAFGSEGNGGGAIFVHGKNADIIESNFTNNYANSNSHARGGAMYISGANAEVIDSKFYNANSNIEGGAIYVNGDNTTINGSEFEKCMVNSPGSEGGAIYVNGTDAVIEGSNFIDSSALSRGGAIYIDGANAKVKDSNFTDSSVTGGKYSGNNPRGGAIYIKADDAIVEGSIFNHSTVSNTVGEGGAIYIEGDRTKILGSEFESSSAYTGGAIYLEGNGCNVSDSLFIDSYAYWDGGAMYSTGSNSYVYKSNFTDNLAIHNGGAVYWYGGAASHHNTVDDCIFTNNTAKADPSKDGTARVTRGGGAIYWSKGGEYGTIKNSEFYYNSVSSTHKVDGGAVLWDASKHALVDTCIFVGNFVTTTGDQEEISGVADYKVIWAQGGAMYLRPAQNYTIRNCQFENCSSSKEAGALYIQSDGNNGNVLIEDTTFNNNFANATGTNINGGGAVQIKQVYKIDFKNVQFINNTANKGGAVSVFKAYDTGDKTFNNCTFTDNEADFGGAIYHAEGAVNGKLKIKNSYFTYNRAGKGSAMYVDKKAFSLTNVQLLKNRANTSSLTLNKLDTINITLKGWDNLLNSIYVTDSTKTVTYNTVTYWIENNKTSGIEVTSPSKDLPLNGQEGPTLENGISLTVELFDKNNKKLNDGNDIFATDGNGALQLTLADFNGKVTSFDDVYVVARLTNEDYYTQVQNTTRLPVTMKAIADNVTYHRNATVHVNITPDTRSPENASGNVSVYYGDVFLGNVTVNNNTGDAIEKILTNITADRFLEVGKHNLTLRYWGDLYNDAINITVPINVTKAQSNITFAFDESGYDLLVNVTIVDDWNDMYYADATGNVTVSVYGRDLTNPVQSKTVYLVNGTGMTFFDLLPANYTIKATYNGDKNYNVSVNSTTAELHKKQDIRVLIDINATAGDIMVDETVYIHVKILTPEGYVATGNVTLYLDNEKYILPLNASSEADFNKSGLSAGFKIVTVCYDGSRDLQANYGDANFTVLKYNTTFTINVTNITHNQKEIINVTFMNDTEGVVYIYVNGWNYSAPINNRTAILELLNLTVGEHNVTVVFPGDWTYNNATNMTRFYVEKITPEVIIDVGNVTYGDPTTVTINVPDCVKGNVTIKINGVQYGDSKQIENGKVKFDLGNLNAGDYTVEAIYGGDTNHTAATSEQKFRVYKDNRTINIDVENIVHGSVEHIVVTVDGPGNVTISVNSKSETIVLDGSGKASLDVSNLTAKTYTVDVTYNGNENYNKSSASKTFVVSRMATALDVQVHNVLVRDMEYLNITVLNSTGEVAKDLNGTLIINIDGVNRTANIVNGTASFNSTEFNKVVGKRVVWVFFNGDVNFTESKAMKTYQVTTRTLDDKEWNVTAQNIYVGQAGNITVNLPKDVTGSVEIEVKSYDGYRDDNYYCSVNDGKAVLYPKDLKEGKYHVYVTYFGTDYEESYLDTFFTVSKFPTTIDVTVFSPIIAGGDATITVTMSPDVNGTVELTVGDKPYYVAVVNGTGTYVVNNLANATYNIKAKYAGDNQYSGSTSNTAILEVNMIPTNLVISIDKTSMNITDNAVVSIELLDKSGKVISINAVVTVKVNGNNHTVGLVSGKGTFTLSGLTNGTYTINAVFAGDDKYVQSISNTVTLDVVRLTPKVNVTATNRSVDETVTITVEIPANATGYVVVSGNFTDNEIYIANSKFTDGVATINVAGLANGTYSVHITYYGLDNDPYTIGVNDTNFTVSKLNATVRIDVKDTDYDNKVNITVYVDNGVEGTITIKLNNTDLGTFGIVNGKVNITIDNPGAESYTVYAIYNGNYKYNVNNTVSKDFTVGRATPVIAIDSVTVDANTSAVITVRINNTATGKMNITVNRATYTADIIDGVATFNNIPVLPVGEYDITANYYALTDTNYTVGSATLVNGLNVTKVKCYPINISTVDVKAGEETTITVYVPIDATGKVYIDVNGTKLNKTVSGGKAEFKLTKEIEGRYVVNATLVDDKYANKSMMGNYYVNYADTVLGIDVTEPVYVNDTAVITVTVPTGITGKVTIEINGESYNNKTVTAAGVVFEVPKITYGNKTVVAIYSGDSKYIANSTTKNFTVIKHDSEVDVIATGNAVGNNATITVNVTDTATGYVVVNVNGTNYTINLTGSRGSVQIAGLGAGTYYVHATYIGDDKYKSSTNITQTFTMTKSDVIMNITVDSIDYGQKANITVNITSDATGFITIRINNTRNITLPINKGKVNWIVDDLAADNYMVYANYSGDGKYNVNNTNKVNKSFEVRQIFPDVDIVKVIAEAGKNATIIVKIDPRTTENITVNVDRDYSIKPNAEGIAVVVTDVLDSGSYTVTVDYPGDKNFTSGGAQVDVVTNKTSDYLINITASDILVDEDTNIVVNVPADAKGIVIVDINGTNYTARIVQGNAVFNNDTTGLAAGRYNITAYFGDDKYENKTADGVFYINKHVSPLTIDVDNVLVGDTAYINVNASTDNVTIEINGQSYNRVRYENGVAYFEVSDLAYGNKTVVAIYGGSNKYVANSTTKKFTVSKRSSQVNVTTTASVVGMDTIINVTIPANATGYVIVDVNGTSYNVNTTNGNGSIVIKNLGNGKYTVNVTYIGDEQYLSSTNGTDFTILRVQPTFAVNGTDITYGAKELIKFESVENITSPVIVEVDGKNYTSFIIEGKGNLTVENLAAGKHNVTIYFAGNNKYLNATANNTFTVAKATIPVVVIPQNITYGDVETFTVYVNTTGNVTITVIDNIKNKVDVTYPEIDINGILVWRLPGWLETGNYTVRVMFNGNANYTENSGSAKFNVSKKDPVMTVNVQNITYGGIEHIIVNVNAPGNVTIKVNGTERTIVLKDGEGGKDILRAIIGAIETYDVKATLDVYNLDAGKYPVEVIYNGAGNYNRATATAVFYVTKDNTTLSVDVDDIRVDGKEIINVTLSNKNATGNVTINVDGVNYTRPITNGTANLTLDKLTNGTHGVVVIYEGDNNFAGNWTSATFNVTKLTSQITIHVDNTTVGKTALITVDIPENATGFVVIDVDGTKYHVDIVKGQQNVTLEIDNLVNKTYQVAAEYFGDDFYDSADAKSSFNVSKVPSQINVTVSHGGIVANGTDVNITVQAPADATGKVNITLWDGLKNTTYTIYVNDGVGVLHLETPEIGIYNVTAKYLGDDKYIGSENKTEFEVYITGKALGVETEPVSAAQNETIKVWVSGNHVGDEVTVTVKDENGNVVFKQNATFTEFHNTNLNMTSANITLNKLPAGDYSVEAVYLERNGTKSIEHTGTGNFTVSKLPSKVTIKEIRNITVGENVTIELEFEPSEATGNISVFVNGVEHDVNISSLTLTIPNLPAEEYNVQALYFGDHNHEGSNDSAVFKVSKLVPVIEVNATNITVGDKELIEITAPNDLESPILVDVGGVGYYVNITGGKGQLYVPGLASGDYNVTVTYLGDDKYTSGNNTTGFKVSKVSSTVNVTVENITVGDKAVINVETPKDLCGNVTVSVDGNNYTVFVSGGKGTLVVPDLEVGPHNVDVIFDGCRKYEPSDNSTKFNVNKVKLDENDIKVIDQGNGTVVVVVPDNATGTVTVKVDGNEFNATVVNGTAVVDVGNLTPGNNDVEVIYSGDGTHANSTVNATIVGPKYDAPISVDVGEVKEGEPVVVTVSVPGNASGNVTVYVGGQEYPAEVIGGIATVTVDNLTAGPKTVAVEYSGDGNYTGNYTISNFTIGEAKATPELTVVDYGNGTVVVVVGDNATGDVTIKVGDKEYNATVVNGTAIVDVGNLTPGINNVEVIYSGDSTHSNSTVNTTITGPKYDSPITVNVTEVKEGEPVVVTVSVPGNASGNVTVYIDGQEHTVEVINGTATVTVDNLTAGPKTVTVEYSGDGNYTANYAVSNFTVGEANVTPELTVVDYGNGTVVVVVGDNATGDVTIKVGDKEFNATVVNGTAVVQLDNLTPGVNNVEVIYSGDSTHANSTVNTTIVGPKYDSSITVDVGEAKEGEPVVVTVSVPGNASGIVTVYVDGQEHTVEVINGTATVIVDNLTAGPKTVAVEYSGDGNYTGNYTISNFTVGEAKATPELAVVDYGNGTVVVVVGDNATGDVTIKVGDKEFNATVVNGTAVIDVGNLTPGDNEVQVIYSGDGTHGNATVNITIVGPKYDSHITVDVGEAKEGEPVVVTVSVPGNASGIVTVYVDGQEHTAEVIGGIATVVVDNLTAGPKTVAVEYSGDGNYTGNYTISNFTVEKAKETPEIYVVNQGNGTVVVIVPDNATGDVTIKVGDKEYNATVVDGKAVIDVDNLAPGDNEIEVIYSGDSTHTNATMTTTVTGPKYESPIEVTTAVTGAGEKAVITVNVPENATGSVTIEVDGVKYTKEITGGNATFEISNLTVGNKTIAVEYSGDGNYTSAHTIANMTVSKVKSSVRAVITDINVGENVTITVFVPKDATGQVLIDIDGVGYYVNVTDGTGTVQIPRMPNGIYPVNLTYVGDDKYLPSSNVGVFDVNKLPSYVIPTAKNITVGENEIIVFSLPTDATGNITVIINGEEFTFDLDKILGVPFYNNGEFTVAVSGGKGVLMIPGMKKGTYEVTVIYNGDDKYLPSSNTTTFRVVENDCEVDIVDLGNGTVKVFVSDNATGNVTIKVDNQTYVAEIHDGVAIINLDNVSSGTHDMEVIYSGDENHNGKTVDSTVEIPKRSSPLGVSTHDIFVDENEHIVVTVPEGATGTVIIEINAVKYSATIKDGEAVFDVKGLAAGNKTVAVTYLGDNNYVSNFTTAQFEVKKQPSKTNANSMDISVGKDEVMVINVPKDATGKVTVQINGVKYSGEIVNGKVKVIIPNLPAGKYKAVVTYEGDDKYLPSSTTTTFSVIKAKTPISANGSTIEAGEDATITVKLPSDATGTVTIIIDGKKYTSKVVNGKAEFYIPGLTGGEYAVKIYYSGDSKYDANVTVATVVVGGDEPSHNNDTGDESESIHSDGIPLSAYETGNPIIVLLLILLAIGSTQLRRLRK